MSRLSQRKRIYVGLSGGVDSAVSAALLCAEGHDVTGVFIRTWHPEGFPCTEGEDEREALRVAAHLDIPFKTLDLSERYETQVARHFIDGYARGETPNPDILCNREVKFGGFSEFARREGVDAIATGHYARKMLHGSDAALLRGLDEAKDQSYFLALVPKEELAFSLFPIGGLRKDEVRVLAQKFKLPNASRPDSQGICFLGAIDLKAFLSKYISLKQGDVLGKGGEVIGKHEGAALYTVGQRHGFRTEGFHEPLYVTEVDIEANTITVAPKGEEVGSHIYELSDVNFLTDSLEGALTAQVRYHGEHYPVSINRERDTFQVHFTKPILAAKGQTIALYSAERLVAGGIISNIS